MSSRRRFLQSSLLAAGAAMLPASRGGSAHIGAKVVSTWDFGVPANREAWQVLAAGGTALDAVEAGARWAETGQCNSTVGRCGYPDPTAS